MSTEGAWVCEYWRGVDVYTGQGWVWRGCGCGCVSTRRCQYMGVEECSCEYWRVCSCGLCTGGGVAVGVCTGGCRCVRTGGGAMLNTGDVCVQ